jgi:cytochrome-b5 reductase
MPTSNNSDLGRIELVIKVYPNGLLTNNLASLNLHDDLESRGRKGSMRY